MQGRKLTFQDILDRLDKTDSGCWIWTGPKDPDGYGKTWWQGAANRRVHRVVYTNMIGPIKDGYHILHKCDNPSCANPDHLWQGTHLENMQDAKQKGRKYVPGQNPNKKLTAFQVKTIHELYASGVSMNKLSKMFDVSRRQIHNIVMGKAWEHLRPPVEGIAETGDPGSEVSTD